ncbi:MAG: HEPN domain-containing protein [Thermomicrobiales bacterium]
MSDLSDAMLVKARESLAGAASEHEQRRYNNAANRAYYACFQAAVAALDAAGISSPGGRAEWGHSFVQAQFAGQLINRRKRYPAELRDTLTLLFSIRQQADYQRANVSQKQATRLLARATIFVDAVTSESGGIVR